MNPPERSNIIKSLEREIQKRIFIPKMKNPYIIKKNLLIVLNLFLTECKGPCSLKYCYLEMPFVIINIISEYEILKFRVWNPRKKN